METFHAGEITANGVTVPIHVTDFGSWTAQYAGQNLSYDTRAKLEARLKNLTRQTKVEVAVPVVQVLNTYPYPFRYRRGVLTGLHAGNGNVTVTWERQGGRGEVKEQISFGYGSRELHVGGDVSDEEMREYARLLEAKRAAVSAVSAWEKEHAINPKEAVKAAIEAKAGKDED